MKTPRPDDEIEMLLGRLSPAPPDEALMMRLRTAEPGGRNIIFMCRWAIPAAAAAALAVMFSPDLQVPAGKAPGRTELSQADSGTNPTAIHSPETSKSLVDVVDLGIATDSSHQPYRLIGATWLDEVSQDTGPGVVPIKKSYIRQEILPVAIQTF